MHLSKAFNFPKHNLLFAKTHTYRYNDLILSIHGTEVCNYADDGTLYFCDKEIERIISRLENGSLVALKWISDNYMKFNEDKCHSIINWQQR